MMQTNCRMPIHEGSQGRFLKKKTVPEFWKKSRFSGLGQPNFQRLQTISGMAMAWAQINLIVALCNIMCCTLIPHEQILGWGQTSKTRVIPGWFCHGCRRENTGMSKRTLQGASMELFGAIHDVSVERSQVLIKTSCCVR